MVTGDALMSSLPSDELEREIERCWRELAEIKNLLRSGHPEVEGLCLALADWSAELRLLEKEKSRRASRPAAEEETGTSRLRGGEKDDCDDADQQRRAPGAHQQDAPDACPAAGLDECRADWVVEDGHGHGITP